MQNIFIVFQLLLVVSLWIAAASSSSIPNDTQDQWFNACASDDTQSLQQLLAEHPDLLNNKMSDTGYTCLMLSALSGTAGAAEFLLNAGANPTIVENDGYTPMHGIAFQGRSNVLPVLLAHGLDPSDRHKDGYTPIHRAAWGKEPRHTETVRALLEAGVSPFEISRDGRTAKQMTTNKATQKLLKKWEKKIRAQENSKKEL